MAIVIKALILCATDDPTEASAAVFRAINGEVFESTSPVVDFAIGIEQTAKLGEDYQDGSFLAQVPGGNLLETANDIALPI
jgi:hypothetical protein